MLAVLRRPYFWLGAAVSVGALALAARGLRIGDVADAFANADYVWLLPATAALLVGLCFRAARWEVLFHPITGLGLANLFGAMNVGYLLNNLLPLRVGEIGRAYVISEVEDVELGQALATVVVERLLDLLLVFALLLVLLPVVDEPDWATGPALFLGCAVLALTGVLAAVGRARRLALVAVEWMLPVMPEGLKGRVRTSAEAALEGFAALGQPQVLLRAGGWSVAAWGCSSVYMYCVLLAFGLHLTYAAPVFVMSAIALGMVVPSSAGYIGVHHAIAIEALTGVFAVDRGAAAGFALVSHALLYITPTILGMVYLWSRRELWRQVLSRVFSRPEPGQT